MFRHSLLFYLFGLMALICSSCSLTAIKTQSDMLDNRSKIEGYVDNTEDNASAIIVRLYRKENSHIKLVNQILADKHNFYYFNVLPGRYFIAAFIDDYANYSYEKSAFYTHGKFLFTSITVEKNQNIVVNDINIKGVVEKANYSAVKIERSPIVLNIGKVVRLQDPMFTRDNSKKGMWRPLDFIDQVGGGLLMLQDYQENKVPVIFVHGMGGNPREFEAIIQQLDRTKYQPWVLYYPSGIDLELVSSYLLQSLAQLHGDYDFPSIHLIAHSMGGLMSRSFLMKHQEAIVDFDISLFVTINSPMYGMDSAASGVKYSPIVISSWRDVASGSKYIKAVHEWRLPTSIPYHLFFSYLPGEDGDGVVPLKSQLSLELQNEATKIYGFNAQHAGILKDEEFIRTLHKILDQLL